MSERVPYRENIGLRTTFRVFDAGLIAAPGAMAATTVLENVQTEAEKLRQKELPVPDSSNPLYDLVTTLPLDAKALGVGAAVVGALALVDAGRLYSSDVSPEGVAKHYNLLTKEKRKTRNEWLRNTAATYGGAVVAGYLGYKYGETLNQLDAVNISIATVASGLAGAKITDIYTRRRLRRS